LLLLRLLHYPFPDHLVASLLAFLIAASTPFFSLIAFTHALCLGLS
jgi:hypothetical protein